MQRSTKIVATLGPASSEREVLKRMIAAGVDVVRMNFSHGSREDHIHRTEVLRDVSRELGRTVGVMVDLQGPKIRIGKFDSGGVKLEKGARFVLDADCALGNHERVGLDYPELPRDVRAGDVLLLDDGRIVLDVREVHGSEIRTQVRHGGELTNNKGINRQGGGLTAPALTAKDMDDIRVATQLKADFLAVSFPKSGADMYMARELMRAAGGQALLVAKIERAEAITALGDIIDASDAIMVARGDLGVELPFEEVPLAQKRVIREANLHGKPVITATQMLESMVHAPRPTRAETSDVANAILDGTDAVMLSAETAVGEYPLEAVQAMVRIAREIEKQRKGRGPAFDMAVGRRREELERLHKGEPGDFRPTRTEDAIAVAVCAAADLMNVPLIVCFTSSGFTARTVASYRPSVPIFAVTPEPDTFRQLALVWGVIPALVEHLPNYDSMLAVARHKLLELNLADPGERVVVTAGVPFDQPGTTNLLKIEAV
jgi:pyruvate kinase